MLQFHEKLETKDHKGNDLTLTATERLIMINAENLSCQFPRNTILPMIDDVATHGILRFVDPNYWEMGLTLFIDREDLAQVIMFLQKYTKSRVFV